YAKLVILNLDPIFGCRNPMIEIPKHRIVFQQVRKCFGVGQIIDSDEIDIGIADRSAEDVTSDATKTIDANFHRHLEKPSCQLFQHVPALNIDQTHSFPGLCKTGSKLAGSKEAQDYAAVRGVSSQLHIKQGASF